ncbi:hypothetical protein ANCDUO_02057 [Ancylostoma duodenale]|uniref:Uncharacterized protein n=1 Tax=Ancylostoma duodenale TaxID=51022 RepID=A0A0C2HDI9_9BILA|nr:hypothetical protein ANCDUO_02057 [Ancylostoma duodenale]
MPTLSAASALIDSTLGGKPIERSRCYPIVMPYTIAISQQAPMAFVIALDLLIALIFPIRFDLRELSRQKKSDLRMG